jgi:hypothetical protein
MNRAERRKLKAKPEPVYNLTASQLEGMKVEATNEAIYKAFTLMIAFPTMVIHDKFEQLAEIPDAQRVKRMGEMIIDLYDSYDRDYVSIQDLHDWLREEVGFEVVQDRGRIIIRTADSRKDGK